MDERPNQELCSCLNSNVMSKWSTCVNIFSIGIDDAEFCILNLRNRDRRLFTACGAAHSSIRLLQ